MGEIMKFRAMIKKSDHGGSGGSLIFPGSMPGKNPGRTVGIFKIGAEDLLSTAVPFEAEAQMTTIDIQTPEWSLENRGIARQKGHTRSPSRTRSLSPYRETDGTGGTGLWPGGTGWKPVPPGGPGARA